MKNVVLALIFATCFLSYGCSFKSTGKGMKFIYKSGDFEFECSSTPGSTEVTIDKNIADVLSSKNGDAGTQSVKLDTKKIYEIMDKCKEFLNDRRN